MLHYKYEYTGDKNTELFIEVSRDLMYNYGHVNKLLNCNAKMYHSFDENIVVLKSYDTPVAIAYIPEGYCIDFSRIVRRERTTIPHADSLPMSMANSRTTSQQISKFCKVLNIQKLYDVYPTKDHPEYIRK